MTIFNLGLIVSVILIVVGVVLECKTYLSGLPATLLAVGIVCGFLFLLFSIIQPIFTKEELSRQNMERQQILYQIENLNENSDKVKLNEWILTYNDWVNDVTISKKIYGWFSWYRDVDITNHTIINLQ